MMPAFVRPSAARLAAWARRFSLATAGIAAVEFSLVLPVMITLYFGLTEVTPAISIQRKLTLVSRALADLSTRSATMSSDDLQKILDATAAIMRPYDTSGKTQMVISSILVTSSSNVYTGKVEWSCGKGLVTTNKQAGDLSLRTKNSTYAVPAGFQNASTKSFVLVETVYPYTPVVGQAITGGPLRLNEQTTWPVRDADKVTYTSTNCP